MLRADIYDPQLNRNKRTILKELIDISVAGDDEPLATLDRTWAQEALAEPDPCRQVRLHMRGARGILRRVSAILQVVREAAASDPDVATLWELNKAQRRQVQRRLVSALAEKGGLRAELDVDRATDLVFAMQSPEMFVFLVAERGWTPAAWEQVIGDALCALLLD